VRYPHGDVVVERAEHPAHKARGAFWGHDRQRASVVAVLV
jgi:hypothetical protein